mgnify:CR=1 FL=1
MKSMNYFKLGLFVLIAIGAAIGVASAVGARALDEKTIVYHTYFAESVSGLNVGAPVQFRGVPVGTVKAIGLAPDGRHVHVSLEITEEEAVQANLARFEGEGKRVEPVVSMDIRAQLGMQGVTGVKYILIEGIEEPATSPPPELSFLPQEPYIPAKASVLKNLQDLATFALEGLPKASEQATSVLERADRMLEVLEERQVPEQAADAVEDAAAALADLREVVAATEKQKFPQRASATLAEIDRVAKRMDKVVAKLDAEDGFIASAQRATDSLTLLGRSTNSTMKGANDTIRSIGEAADAIRELAEVLERDPDMLLKGRAAARKDEK